MERSTRLPARQVCNAANERMKVKFENAFFNTQNKEGERYINKNNKPFTMIAMFYDGGKKASMYCENERDGWKMEQVRAWNEGDEIEVTFEESNGFTNFNLPSKAQVLEDENAALKAQLEAMKTKEVTEEDLDNMVKEV